MSPHVGAVVVVKKLTGHPHNEVISSVHNPLAEGRYLTGEHRQRVAEGIKN